MKYSKKQVNEIVDQIMLLAQAAFDREWANVNFEKQIELVKEEHSLIDRRVNDISFYATDIIEDFTSLRFTYREIAEKYHTSENKVRNLLKKEAKDNATVYYEMEYRKKD